MLDSCTITVNVAATAVYGYQGGSNAIKMTSPTVGSFTQSGTTYLNQLGTLAAVDGYYTFTVLTSAGFRSYNTPEAFAEINEGNIALYSGDSGTSLIAELEGDNEGDLFLASVNHDTRTIVVKVAQSAIGSGVARLAFLPNFRGNNANNKLDATVYFQFTAA